MYRRGWLIVALLGLVAACGTPDAETESPDTPVDSTEAVPSETPDAEPPAAEPASKIQVEDVAYQRLPGGRRVVSGHVTNVTDETIPVAQLQVSLFDANNRRVDQMSILLRDLPPGERLQFQETVDSDEDVQGARVRSVLVR